MNTNESRFPASKDIRPEPKDPYLTAWADLRRRRAMLWASVVALPFVAPKTHLFSFASALLAPLVWALLFFAMGRVQLYSCPRCRDLYALRNWLVGSIDMFFTDECKHCGLRMGATKKRFGLRS